MRRALRLARAGVTFVTLAALQSPGAAQRETRADVWRLGVLEAINRARAELGLHALQPAPELLSIAQRHSDEMAASRQLSHGGFQSRFDQTGSSLCVENVAHGTTRADTLVAAWARAPVHRRNLLEPRVQRAAVAASGAYVTFFACE